MSFPETIVLGALAGFTIFLGLPVGRLQLLKSRPRVALAMFSVGVLAFIFVDVMSSGLSIVDDTLHAVKAGHQSAGYLIWLVVLLGGGFVTGSAGLAMLERRMRPVSSRRPPIAGGVVLIGMGVLIWTGEFTQLNITVNHWLQTLGLPDFNSDT